MTSVRAASALGQWLPGSDRLDYATERGIIANGRLNPTWVEWLMGFPAERDRRRVVGSPPND